MMPLDQSEFLRQQKVRLDVTWDSMAILANIGRRRLSAWLLPPTSAGHRTMNPAFRSKIAALEAPPRFDQKAFLTEMKALISAETWTEFADKLDLNIRSVRNWLQAPGSSEFRAMSSKTIDFINLSVKKRRLASHIYHSRSTRKRK